MHWLTQNDYDTFKVKYIYVHYTHTHIHTIFFICFALWSDDWHFQSSYRPILRQVHWMTPNDLDISEVKSTHVHPTLTPDTPIFRPFYSMISCFEIQAIFIRFSLWYTIFELQANFETGSLWHQNDLNMFEVKINHVYFTCTHEAQSFIHFSLWWAIFEENETFLISYSMSTINGKKYF